MTLILPLSIFLAIGHRWSNGHKEAYDHYQWEGFAVVLSTGILATIVAAWKSDPVWSLGSVWVLWCIGAARPKAAPVSVCGVSLTLVPSEATLKTLAGHYHRLYGHYPDHVCGLPCVGSHSEQRPSTRS